MKKYTLFLLKNGFLDNNYGPFYCPDTAAVEGFLKFNPEIENQITVKRINFEKPRQEVIDLLGEENQGCPVLVIEGETKLETQVQVSEKTGKAFINDIESLCDVLAIEFNGTRPHSVLDKM